MWPKTNRTDLVAWRPSVTRWAAVGWVGRGSTAAHCDWWWGCPRPLCRTVVGRLDPASGGRPGRRVPPTCPCRGSRSGCPWWWRCGRAGSRPRPAWRWTPAPRDEGGFKLLIFWHIRFANLVRFGPDPDKTFKKNYNWTRILLKISVPVHQNKTAKKSFL